MSKIRNVQVTTSLGGKYAGQYYDASMEYSPNGKVFFIRVPKDQKELGIEWEDRKKLIDNAPLRGYSEVEAFTGKLEQEVLDKAQKYFNLFLKALRSEQKVILYSICYGSAKIKGNLPSGMGSRVSSTVEVDFLVVNKVQVGLNVRYIMTTMEQIPFGHPGHPGEREVTQDKSNLVDDGYSGYKVMEWTKEREIFFQNMIEAMDKMIEKIETFVKEPKVFVAMIDHGGNLLTAGKDKQ